MARNLAIGRGNDFSFRALFERSALTLLAKHHDASARRSDADDHTDSNTSLGTAAQSFAIVIRRRVRLGHRRLWRFTRLGWLGGGRFRRFAGLRGRSSGGVSRRRGGWTGRRGRRGNGQRACAHVNADRSSGSLGNALAIRTEEFCCSGRRVEEHTNAVVVKIASELCSIK